MDFYHFFLVAERIIGKPGVVKDSLVLPLLGEIIQFDLCFSKGLKPPPSKYSATDCYRMYDDAFPLLVTMLENDPSC